MENQSFKTLLVSSDLIEIGFVKSILEAEGIEYVTVGEMDQKILQSSCVEIRVPISQFEAAKKALEDFPGESEDEDNIR